MSPFVFEFKRLHLLKQREKNYLQFILIHFSLPQGTKLPGLLYNFCLLMPKKIRLFNIAYYIKK